MKIEGLTILLVVVILSSSVSAITGSIGNARAIINVEVGFFGTTIERTILVKNVNDVPVNITLEPSEEFKDMVNILDKEFTLQAGEEKKAKFNVNIKKPGDYEGRINVFFKSEGEKTGVALTSTIIIHAVKKGSLNNDEDVEPVDEEIVNENETTDITGNVISNNNSKINTSLIAVLISTLVLAAILIFLIFKIKTKKHEKTGEKVNKKRADRSS